MHIEYSRTPDSVEDATHRTIAVFHPDGAQNRDDSVIESFGEEWSAFDSFSEDEITQIAAEYFDIVGDDVVGPDTYAIDIGCGTGRWTKALLPRVAAVEAVDPSQAAHVADRLLGSDPKVRITRAGVDSLPFPPETFDFAMSVGVLHHVPDTATAIAQCAEVVKPGGHLYLYLYYDLENRGPAFKALFSAVDSIRRGVSSLPARPKQVACDLLAALVYLPVISAGRAVRATGRTELADRLPLSWYHDKTWNVIRNDSLDRFGTTLEQRFSRAQITEMMKAAGLTDVRISDGPPFWHAIARKP